ncbi:hypothetical protein COHA_006801 [Chlorella ohadii]|uniref:Plant heme peroxidase family profile domain-containing protein n=1 Tax=Chlorella ohadii TaxID=2649997 RepID=A0AAD5DP81_9CHLO|nr:hypothetical protein COHA_006801 [Chlorella ohadii]
MPAPTTRKHLIQIRLQPTTKKGGPNGSLRYETTYAANSDSRMVQAVAYIDKWAAAINARLAAAAQGKHRNPRIPAGTKISLADVTKLAGAAAVAALGGPSRYELFNLVPLGRKDQGFADDVSGLPAPFFGFGDLACRFRGMGYTLQVQGSVWLDYFTMVLMKKGAFTSDNTLLTNRNTASLVRHFAKSQRAFYNAFAHAYLKMASMNAVWQPYM